MNKKGAEFFECGAVDLAQRLLGTVLCIARGHDVARHVITETEAYGIGDTACHAFRGRTRRNDPMFCRGGTVYVYLCYGIHEMFNISAGRADEGQAVLIRGLADADGPGKVTKLLGLDRSFNYEFLPSSARIWIETGTVPGQITALPRVGINYASAADRARLWRFKWSCHGRRD
jgi:DNA-3-methyladenine glycosylase